MKLILRNSLNMRAKKIIKKVVLLLAFMLTPLVSTAQFTDTNDIVRLMGKFQFSGRASLINDYGLIKEGGGGILIQNIITPNLNFDVGMSLWFGNDVNSIAGFDFSLGLLYTVKPPFYIFGEIHPRMHNEHYINTGGTIGDEFCLYGVAVLGAGYAFHIWKEIYLFTETGFNFIISTSATASNNAMLRNDIQYYMLFGLLIRSF